MWSKISVRLLPEASWSHLPRLPDRQEPNMRNANQFRNSVMMGSADITAFLRACRKGNSEEIVVLGRAGCDEAAKDNDGWTALMAAASEGSTAVYLCSVPHTMRLEIFGLNISRDQGQFDPVSLNA